MRKLKKIIIALLTLITINTQLSTFQAQTMSEPLSLIKINEVRPTTQLTTKQLIEKLPKSASLDDPFLILVNHSNVILEEAYIPFVYAENGMPYHESLYEPLLQLRQAAGEQGYYYNFISGYRSIYQQSQNRENRYYSYLAEGYDEYTAQYLVDQFYAPYNASEHTTGLAIDLLGTEFGYELIQDYQYYASAQWLASNAHHYGFILRYLDGKTDITNINFEPWHLRYVGVENATYMYENGLVLEEYIALINERDQQNKHTN